MLLFDNRFMRAGLQKQLEYCYLHPQDEKHLEKLFRAVDKDHSNKLDYAEFLPFVQCMCDTIVKSPASEERGIKWPFNAGHAWLWASQRPQRWFWLYCNQGVSFPLFFSSNFADLKTMSAFLAKLGYFRSAAATGWAETSTDESVLEKVGLSVADTKFQMVHNDVSGIAGPKGTTSLGYYTEEERVLLRYCQEGTLGTTMCKSALQQGADPTIVNEHTVERGATPLFFAAKTGNADLFHELVRYHKCRPDHRSYKGQTALHAACAGYEASMPEERRKQYAEIVVHITKEYPATIEIKDDEGRVPVIPKQIRFA